MRRNVKAQVNEVRDLVISDLGFRISDLTACPDTGLLKPLALRASVVVRCQVSVIL
jgi:hypothetical protein